MQPTDFKNVIVENIPPALFEDAEVAEVKQQLGGLRGCWGLEAVFEVTEAKISKSSSFYHFS